MIAPVPFDPARFRSAAADYLGSQPEYAPALVPAVARLCGLDGGGQLLDLGCGPGQLAAAFRPFVAGALGMDPEPEMLALARTRAAERNLDVTFQDGGSLDLVPEMGPFRLVAIGRAFHWMDRVATLAMLDRLVLPGGAVVLFRTIHPDVPDNAWHTACDAAVMEATGAGTRQAWRLPGWVKHEAVLLDSPFCALMRLGVIERRRTPGPHLVQRALSMSRTTRARLGPEGAARLTADVSGLVGRAATDGVVMEVVESAALVARRPGS